jgi:hypothetical protein
MKTGDECVIKFEDVTDSTESLSLFQVLYWRNFGMQVTSLLINDRIMSTLYK